jgi:hypothetical protein
MWQCPKCCENVEDTFDVCLNCGTSIYCSFPCPFCQGRLKKGQVIGGDYVMWRPAGLGFWKRLFFRPKASPLDGGRCDQCGVIILGKAEEPPPPPWTVRISEQQQAKSEMPLVQQLLLRQGIPSRAAYKAAGEFRRGKRAVVLVRDAEAGRVLVNALQGLGLAAEVAAPQSAEGTGPPD